MSDIFGSVGVVVAGVIVVGGGVGVDDGNGVIVVVATGVVDNGDVECAGVI